MKRKSVTKSVSDRKSNDQLQLFPDYFQPCPPSTRYQGSKLKLIGWIWDNIKSLSFHTALDAFGGTGSVAYHLKANSKKVTYNDNLRFNHLIGKAIIENTSIQLSHNEAEKLFIKKDHTKYHQFIGETFSDIYFTDDENTWLDIVCQNISSMSCEYQQALAFYSLFQACIAKRPYNLFHRRNLYMRTSEVKRSFGNKATWDTPFETHFHSFLGEANRAVFDTGIPCSSLCHDALEVPGEFDLVYIDTPYLNGNGQGVDYFQFYHFLEGLCDYAAWPARINTSRKHIPLNGDRSAWSDPRRSETAFGELFEKYQKSILVVSYRSDGIPSVETLIDLLRKYKKKVKAVHYGEYKYVLSKNSNSKEVLLIGI
jgi:adenine-specific DNA-methyltransferase